MACQPRPCVSPVPGGRRTGAADPDGGAPRKAGDDKERKKKSGFFVGEVMKATRGQADGRAVNELLARRSAG